MEAISLRNFQRHKKLVVSLEPGLNCVIGPNSSGKSSLFRAVRAVCLNRFRPGHLRHGKSTTTVSVTVDGNVVKAVRGKERTLSLGKKTFRATKKEVPPEVSQLLNVGEENFQQQGDVHFWFSLPPSQVAARLNEIVDLSLIDRSVSRAKTNAAQAARRREFTEDRLKKAITDERRLRWAPRAARLLADLDTIKKARDQAESKVDRLSTLAHGMEKAIREAGILRRIIQEGRSTLQTGKRALEADRASTRLLGALKSITSLQKDLKIRVPNMLELDNIRSQADRAAERCRTLEYLIQDLTEVDRKVRHARNEYQAFKTKRCPTCGNVLRPSGN